MEKQPRCNSESGLLRSSSRIIKNIPLKLIAITEVGTFGVYAAMTEYIALGLPDQAALIHSSRYNPHMFLFIASMCIGTGYLLSYLDKKSR